ATAAALSDLAAAAARPLGLLLALTIPERWRGDVADLTDGIGEAARAALCPIVGGDLSRGTELSLTVTVLGGTSAPLRRDGARPGDTVWVTGRLGGPHAALRAWLEGRAPRGAHRDRFARPVPRLGEARWLAARGATAAVDLSDGLVADLRHVAAASGVVIELDAERVPRIEGVTLDDALGGGEEYELIVTMGPDASFRPSEFEDAFDVPITRIGHVVSRGAPSVVARVDLPGGHDHFSR
ncbi:MAG TPA: thiamine-phosphate kinase, partial [Gemmatimonadaceae bacterium]|nr:thiamine-phosphate kinase [Gemmatimonadaceae bacterium]